MKKIIYFIPALIFAAFYGFIIIGIRLPVMPIVYAWIAAFVISGILLSKGVFWGSCFGILPGLHLMYMSTIDTGQILPIEMPLGIIIVIFYVLCCVFVWYKKKKVQA